MTQAGMTMMLNGWIGKSLGHPRLSYAVEIQAHRFIVPVVWGVIQERHSARGRHIGSRCNRVLSLFVLNHGASFGVHLLEVLQ